MLVLKRKEGQWVQITHAASGDVLRIRVYDIAYGTPARANLAFDDAARNFTIERPERAARPPVSGPMPSAAEPESTPPLKLAESA